MNKEKEFAEILIQLSKKDPKLSGLFKQIKLQPLKKKKNHFQSLVTAIISQQLSVKAADTIEKRFVALFGVKDFPSPEQVLKMPDKKLRGSGLSFSKISYIKNIARAVESGELNFKKLVKLSDQEIIEKLIKIKGIGRWTAEMFLIFSLARPNVFSRGDLGLKNALKRVYKVDMGLHTKKLKNLLDLWHPHHSIVSRYLWKSLELR